MFLELNTGDLINLLWVDNVYQDKEEKTKVIYVRVNGTPIVEIFSSASEATSRYEEVKEKMLKM